MKRKARKIAFLVLAGIVVLYILVLIPNLKDGRKIVHEEDMRILRQAIHAYTVDNGRPPDRLEDLVTGGYLKSIPSDPLLPNLREMDPIALKDYLVER